MTDNAAFVELMENYMDSQSRNQFWTPSRTRKSAYCQPTWEFWFDGALSHRGVITSMKSPFTWGSLLGFPDDPWEYSQAFWGALQQLEALGIDGASRKRLQAASTVRWECELVNFQVSGDQTLYEHPTPVLLSARVFFDSGVPLDFQFWVGLRAWKHSDTLQNGGMARNIQTDTLGAIVHLPSVYRSVTEMTAAVGQVALSSLIQETIDRAQTYYDRVHVKGVPKYLGINYIQYAKYGEREYLSRLDVVGTMEHIGAHSSLCSAVAEASSADRLDIRFKGEFDQNTGPLRWAWLVYAVFCGTTSVSRESVDIRASLTGEDVSVVQEVLRRKYPEPMLEQSSQCSPEYGFVDIRNGAQLFGRNGIRLDITRDVRCRALHCPETMDGSVDVVVPGFGICTARIASGINFVKDTICPILPLGQPKGITSLTLDLIHFESDAVLIQLLSLIGRGLRSLSLESRKKQVELCMLATACPKLEDLRLTFFGVRASDPNDALRQWPIRTMYVCGADNLSALVTCLTDDTLRMRQTLVDLYVVPLYNSPSKCEDKRRLSVFDGEFLPATKEKLPKEAKAAMISAVKSGWNRDVSTGGAVRALGRLDAAVLTMIFHFASTPEQRRIRFGY